MSSDLLFSIGADPADFNRGMAGVVQSGTQYAGDITKKVGDKMFGLRDVSNVVSSALGLNLKDIADNLARWLTGISKEEEAAYKKSAELSDQALEVAKKNMLARLTDEQRYQLALEERDKIQAKLEAAAGSTGKALEAAAQLRLDLENKTTEIQAYELKQAEQRQAALDAESKARSELSEKMVSAYNDSLTLEGKIAALKDEIVVKQAAINGGLLTGKTLEEQKNFLAARQVDLANAEAEAIKRAAAEQKKANDERESAIDGYRKAKFDELDVEHQLMVLEKERADLITYLAALPKNSAEYMDQYVVLAGINKQITERTQHEKAVVDQLQQQLALERAIKGMQDQWLADLSHATYQFNGKAYGPAMSQQQVDRLSPDVLNELIKRNQAAIDEINASKTNANSADVASGFLAQAEAIAQRQTEIIRAQYVLNQNNQLRGVDRATALSHYTGDIGMFDTAYAAANSPQSQQLKDINQTLQIITQHVANL